MHMYDTGCILPTPCSIVYTMVHQYWTPFICHTGCMYYCCTVYIRDRDAPGLDTVVPLETTAAYNMMDVITGVSRSISYSTFFYRTRTHPVPASPHHWLCGLLTVGIGWGQLLLSIKAKLNQTVLTWVFPVLNVYLLVWTFSLSL